MLVRVWERPRACFCGTDVSPCLDWVSQMGQALPLPWWCYDGTVSENLWTFKFNRGMNLFKVVL